MLQMYINLLWVNAILLLLVFLPDFWQGLEKGGVGVLQRHIIKTVDENVAMCVCVCVCMCVCVRSDGTSDDAAK